MIFFRFLHKNLEKVDQIGGPIIGVARWVVGDFWVTFRHPFWKAQFDCGTDEQAPSLTYNGFSVIPRKNVKKPFPLSKCFRSFQENV